MKGERWGRKIEREGVTDITEDRGENAKKIESEIEGDKERESQSRY